MDIEYIQTSNSHKCVRKLYLLASDGATDLERDFYPCKRYRDIHQSFQQSYRYCRRHIHRLQYDPRQYSPKCSDTITIVKNFITHNDIDYILYKGGTIERELCEKILIPSFNIEHIPGITKAPGHNPKIEVRFHYNQLMKL